MSVYKYDENTQTMREYDIAYQVQGQECPEAPNTLETLTTPNPSLIMDNTWLPYMHITSGEYLLSNNTAINMFKGIKLIPDDLPGGIETNSITTEQILIDNRNTRWGAIHANASYVNSKRFSFIDEEFTGDSEFMHSLMNTDIAIQWMPNGNTLNMCHWSADNNNTTVIINSKEIDNLGWDTKRIYKTIYLTESLHQTMIEKQDDTWNTNYEPHVIDFTEAETEWLENYFIIEQDGSEIEWYESNMTNEYGKYIRLKKNGANIAELCYWKDGEVKKDIGANLTDTAVTKTGSITHGDITKNYSVTQKPMTRTVKARMYFNPVEEDGKLFNNFCMWPFNANFGVNDDNWNKIIKYFLKIRYRAVGDTTWTDMTLPTVAELKQKSIQISGGDDVQLIDLYTVEINTAGYYDVEWMYDADKLYTMVDQWNSEGSQWMFTDRKMWYDYENRTYEAKQHEDMYLENTPFVISMDYGKQYCNEAIGKHSNTEYFNIRDWDDNPRMETLSVGPCTAPRGRGMYTGMMTRGLKYLVYNNIQRGDGHFDWVGVENWEETFSNEGSLFYVTPERQKFSNWFLGCSTVPHTIYLHPDIYAMDNHGFNDQIEGWESWRYSDAGSPELRELPSNWRELIPNYIGE